MKAVILLYILLCFLVGFVDRAFSMSYSYCNDIIILLIFGCFIIKKRGKLNIKPMYIFLFFILLNHLCYLIIKDNLSEALKTGRTIIIIYSYIIIFYLLIKDNFSEKSIIYYKKIVFLIIKINIIFILSEIIINMMGYGYLIKEFIPIYRLDLPSPIINKYINIAFTGPNSLVMNAQNASIISLMGIILFANISRCEKMSLASYFWLLLAVISYLASVTTTSLLCFTISILLLIFVFKNSRFNKLHYKIIFTGFIIIFFNYIIMLFRYRFADDSLLEYYLRLFLNPLVVMSDFSITDFMFGIGSSFLSSGSLPNFKHADFGFGVLMIIFGLSIMALMMILYILYSIKLIYNLNNAVHNHPEMSSIILKNYLCTLVVLVSIIHYSTLLFPGMRQFFAFQIALTCVLLMRTKSERVNYPTQRAGRLEKIAEGDCSPLAPTPH